MFQHSVALYFSAVFIWGSTFFAIKFQLGEVAEEVSVAYRFALAAAVLAGWCAVRGLRMRFTLREHFWMGLQGVFLFCVNYLLVYLATDSLSSGLIAVIFSTIVLMNIVNGAIFFRTPISLPVTVGALFGMLGISMVFWPELAHMNRDATAFRGFGLAMLGTFVASLGNIISARNQKAQIPVIQSNAYGMAYGASVLAVAAAAQGISFSYASTIGYTVSLLYLALFGSVLAFGSYLTLLGRIGPEKAAYVMVLFPLVALAISTVFENYVWTMSAALGVSLVLAGNVLMVMPRRFYSTAFSRRPRWAGGD